MPCRRLPGLESHLLRSDYCHYETESLQTRAFSADARCSSARKSMEVQKQDSITSSVERSTQDTEATICGRFSPMYFGIVVQYRWYKGIYNDVHVSGGISGNIRKHMSTRRPSLQIRSVGSFFPIRALMTGTCFPSASTGATLGNFLSELTMTTALNWSPCGWKQTAQVSP